MVTRNTPQRGAAKKVAPTRAAPKKSWDADENEAQSNFISFAVSNADSDGNGDFIYGSLIAPRREVPNRLAEKPGTMQWLYEVKVHECEYHVLDAKKKVLPDAVVPEVGETIVVGGKASFDHKLAHLKVGQMFGIKFDSEKEASTPGRNPSKVFKVYLPKDETTGEFLMDESVAAVAEAETGDDDF